MQLLASNVQNTSSFVIPTNEKHKETCGDSEHTLSYVTKTVVIHIDIVKN